MPQQKQPSVVKIFAVGIATALAVTSASSESLGIGSGTQSCGTYLQGRRVPNDFVDYQTAQWVWGYLSAYNRYVAYSKFTPVSKNVPSGDVLAYLDKYCRENPLHVMAQAMDVFIPDLLRGP